MGERAFWVSNPPIGVSPGKPGWANKGITMATQNPYLSSMGDALTSQVTNNLQRNVLPGINRGAIAAGGFGGSRQGIAQGIAIGDTNRGLSNSLANMYGQAYEGDANRSNSMAMQSAQIGSNERISAQNDATQRYGLGNQYSLGQGNLALGNKQADQGFYSQQRGQDLQAQGQGFNQYLQSLNAQLGMGQQQYNIGMQQQNAPADNLKSYGGALSPFTGLNGSQSTTSPESGGGLAGAAGGALTMAQLLKLLGGG